MDGAKGYPYPSKTFEPGLWVHTWYGINGHSGGNTWIPCRRWPTDGRNPQTAVPLPKITDIRRSAETVFLFDGVSFNMQTRNANRLNARHNRRTQTNILFFDGHAATHNTKSLPGGLGNAGNDSGPAQATFSLENLQNYPGIVWRLDQK
jgi:prepilin-type processing-associated H-X9-DG protein